jgi:hypothetical protein
MKTPRSLYNPPSYNPPAWQKKAYMILLYIRNHPGMTKTDLCNHYKEYKRAEVAAAIDMLVVDGEISMDEVTGEIRSAK